MKVTINKKILEVTKGDITEQETDAIVNAANNHLWMGAGVAGAIKRKGGEAIEEEAVALGPIDVGAAVMTSAGKLRARHVIHAAVMGQNLHTNEDHIRAAVDSSLALADQRRLTSISIPALGTGVGGFSIFHCASILIEQAVEFLQKARSVTRVNIVLFDDETFSAFRDELVRRFSSRRH